MVKIVSKALFLLVLVVSNSTVAFAQNSPTHYYGGPILTMAGDRPVYVESVVSLDGKIAYAGKQVGAKKQFPNMFKLFLSLCKSVQNAPWRPRERPTTVKKFQN